MDEKDKKIKELEDEIIGLEESNGQMENTIECLEDRLGEEQRKRRNLEADYEDRIRSIEYDMDRMRDDYDRQVKSLEDQLSNAEYQIRNLEAEVQNARYRQDW